MRRKRIIRLITTILIIVAIGFIITKLINKEEVEIKRLVNLHEELNTNQTYLFEIKKDNKNKTIMAKKDDKTLIDQYSENNHSTTIVKDNNTYLVLHDREEYYVYAQNNVEQSILTDGLQEVVQNEFVTGNEKVKGKKYDYEEYAGSTIFMVASASDVSEENIKTRFYFDKEDNLVYIKTIYGSYQEILKVKVEKNVDDSIFEIPSNYAEN